MSAILRAAMCHERWLAVRKPGKSFSEEAKDAILAVHNEFGAPGNFAGAEAEALRWLYETLALYDAEAQGTAITKAQGDPR